MGEKYFTDVTKRRNIVTIYPSSQFTLNNELRSVKSIQKCNIIVEKADLCNLMQLRLCDVNDQTKMYLCTIDSVLYERIKNEQFLHVSFQDFVDNLYKILDCCKREELSIAVIQDNKTYFLEFYEKRPFKNLIHLYLPILEAPIETILFHINFSFNSLHEQLNNFIDKNKKLKNEVSYKEDYIVQLNSEVMKLKGKISEQENMIFNRNCEEMNKLQQTIKDLQYSKENDEQKFKSIISKLQHQNDLLTKENCICNERLKHEIKKQNDIREEVNCAKLGNASLKEQIGKLENEVHLLKGRDKKNEFVISENRKLIQDLNEKLKTSDKQKNELRAELEAEKNICQIKRNALQISSEEISKANSIILKQNNDIMQLKKTIELRSQAGSRQEEAIKEKENKNLILNKKLLKIALEHEKFTNNNKDFSEILLTLKKNADEMEEKYKQKINELQKRIIGEPPNSNSNRYLRDNHDFNYR